MPEISVPESSGVPNLETAIGIVVEPIRINEWTGRFTFFKAPDGLPLELYKARVSRLGCDRRADTQPQAWSW